MNEPETKLLGITFKKIIWNEISTADAGIIYEKSWTIH